ncbi:MAG: UDP-2,3-diacylglucosamine diphosphatase LpxI [Leptospirales bacterium]
MLERVSERIGIVTGSGKLPGIAVSEALLGSVPFKVYTTDDSVKLPSVTYDIESVKIEKFGRLLKLLKKDKITQLVILGKMYKDVLLRDIGFDLKALSVIRKMKNKSDHTLYTAIATEIEKAGIEILPQTSLLKTLVAQEKFYTKGKLSKEQQSDIDFGLVQAVKLSELDIGQTVVVSRGIVLAVEALEGTDATIRRGGSLAKQGSAVVCKATRTTQDIRFDIPTIGLTTLKTMQKYNCTVLAVEAGRTLLVDQQKMVETAEKSGIIIVAKSILRR